jgi:hypothetical protein
LAWLEHRGRGREADSTKRMVHSRSDNGYKVLVRLLFKEDCIFPQTAIELISKSEMLLPRLSADPDRPLKCSHSASLALPPMAVESYGVLIGLA